MVARLWTFEFSDDKADALNDNPDGKSGAIYLLTYSLGYTFADSRTQVFMGTDHNRTSITDFYYFLPD
jgi:hypothetical protein